MRPRYLVPLTALVATAASLTLSSTALGAPADFTSAGQFKVGNTAYDLTLADFDGDSTPDVAVPNANGASVSVLLGDGDGTFTQADESPITVGSGPRGVAAADFNNDGDADLAVAESNTDTVSVFRGDGDGTFTPGTTVSVSDGFRIAAGNLNGDGDPDLAVTNYTTPTGGLTVLLGGAGASFSVAPTSPEAVGSYPTDVLIGNFNGGGADVAVANSDSGNVSILLGAGTGDLTAAASSPEAAGSGPFDLAVGSFNAGADQDLAVADASFTGISILLGSATGDFTQPASSPEVGSGYTVAAGDLDGDSDTDLASLDDYDKVVVLLNDGTGNFAAMANTIPVPALANEIDVADTDGDVDQDLLITGGNGGYYVVTSLINNEPDADDDGVADVGDECPTVPATQGCPALDREVKLRYVESADAFKGRLVSTEETCEGPREKVRLIRSRQSGDAVVAKTKTAASGKFRIDRSASRGQYFAKAPRSVDPDVGSCPEAESPTVRPG
jgi:hypothetical protein